MTQPNLRGPIALSIAAAILTIAMKAAAYLLTGSVGLLADALEAGLNLIAAATAYFSLWYAARPADPNHTYGHEKIEFFSSGLEGVLICAAGLATVVYAARHLLQPHELGRLGLGVGLGLAATAANFVVARLLLRVGRETGSLVLQADGHHLMTDVWTTLGVVAGLVLVAVTGVRQLDAIVALVVGLQIVVTGFRLVRLSFNGLMDHALAPGEQERLREVIRAALPAGAAFHHLRTRQAGRRKFADFHLLVDGAMTVREGHALANQIEERLAEAVPDLEVTIHIEPVDEPTAWESDRLAQLGEAPEPGDELRGPSCS